MCRRAPRSERGAAAVEFALVMPILLLLIFGLIQYGLYFWALQGGADAARHGARLSAVGNPVDCSDFQSDVAAKLGGFSQGTPTIRRTYSDTEEANSAATPVDIGDRVEVTVTFNSIDLNFPFVPFIDNGTVSETVVARVDYVYEGEQPEACP